MKNIILVIILFTMISCNNKSQEKNDKTNQTTEETKESLKLYQRTEMALLMLDMYEEMEQTKYLINKDSILPSNISKLFYNIHTGQLTTPSVRDENYSVFATQYLNNLEYLYANSKTNAVENYNNVVTSCIACHQTKCTGPIPKIKKLYIKSRNTK